jgi:taurine dioxygenase
MTLTASRIEITPTDAALGAVITGVDVSRSVEPEVILPKKLGLKPRPSTSSGTSFV